MTVMKNEGKTDLALMELGKVFLRRNDIQFKTWRISRSFPGRREHGCEVTETTENFTQQRREVVRDDDRKLSQGHSKKEVYWSVVYFPKG